MKSPITGKEMTLTSEIRTIAILDKVVEYEHEFYLCEDSGTQWTTTEIDERNLNRTREDRNGDSSKRMQETY